MDFQQVKWLSIILFFNSLIISAQNKIDCDSVFSVDSPLSDSLHWNVYMAEPKFNLDSLKILFNELAQDKLTGNEDKIYVGILVDSIGNVSCAKVFKPNNPAIDTFAINFVKELKFKPAIYVKHNKPIELKMMIPFVVNKK